MAKYSFEDALYTANQITRQGKGETVYPLRAKFNKDEVIVYVVRHRNMRDKLEELVACIELGSDEGVGLQLLKIPQGNPSLRDVHIAFMEQLATINEHWLDAVINDGNFRDLSSLLSLMVEAYQYFLALLPRGYKEETHTEGVS